MDSEDVQREIANTIYQVKSEIQQRYSLANYVKEISRGIEAIQLLEDLLRHLEQNKRIKNEFKDRIYNFVKNNHVQS